MVVGTERYGPVSLLRPAGALDASASEAFEKPLLAALASVDGSPALVVVDFTAVPFISSAGLRVIMIGAKHARESGARLAVAAMTATVREIFEISRFHHVVPIFATVAEAIGSISEAGAAAFAIGRREA
jgi:anti-sigma B factor antagonist